MTKTRNPEATFELYQFFQQRMGSPKVILCYRRKSLVVSNTDLISPEIQAQAVESHVHALGYRVEWYEDIDGHKSGRHEAGRPGWLNLKTQLDRDDVAGIAAYDLSRLYRNTREFLQFIDRIQKRKLRLIIVNENIDTSSSTGQAVLTILMAMYQLEADLASDRITTSISYKREQLGLHWGPVPFGCQRDRATKELIPDPTTYEVSDPQTEKVIQRTYHATLQALYEYFATGAYTYRRLAVTMNVNLYRFRNRAGESRLWTTDDVRRTLAAWQLYRGDLPLGRKKDNPTTVVQGAHRPILPPELCDQVAAQLILRRKRYTKSTHHTYLLTGIIYCGSCKRKLGGANYKDKGARLYRHQEAKRECPEIWVEVEVLEEQILNLLTAINIQQVKESVDEQIAKLLLSEPQTLAIVEQIQTQKAQLNLSLIHI